MTTPRRVKDLLVHKASANFVGRSAELAVLMECLADSGPLLTWVHGIAGIGKSTLLGEFQTQAQAAGARVVTLDCRFLEPSPASFERAVETLIDDAEHGRTVLLIDSYECLLLLDSWLRQSGLPELPATVRIVIASRYAPNASWLLALEWQGLLRVLPLRELADADAEQLLTRAGTPAAEAKRLNRWMRGNPLALRLAAASLAAGLAGHRDAATSQELIRQLAAVYLDGLDAPLRAAVEAASVVLCLTRALLAAMLPDVPAGVYDRLASSCFVETTGNGLVLHDAVREAVAGSLRTSDPARYRSYRAAAWQQLRAEVDAGNSGRVWAHTRAMIYLLENPIVREAFFPANAQSLAVEPAVAKDGAGLLAIAGAHETPAAARLIERWWQQAPESFRAARDHTGKACGFSLFLELRNSHLPRMEEDPITRAWRRHLREQPLAPGQTAVLVRRWLCAEQGELPSAVQAACWLDVKRCYVELRPQLRRCYLSLCDLGVYGPTARTLGFRLVDEASVTLDGVTHHLVYLDFGPGSVDGWLTGMVGAELGVKAAGFVDLDARELILDGERIPLTVLEFELLHYLEQRAGKAVARAELLEHIWQRREDASSNVVDSLVRGLRRKMGPRAAQLATVRGYGYSFRSSIPT